jgi:hypothetical protein
MLKTKQMLEVVEKFTLFLEMLEEIFNKLFFSNFVFPLGE